jgi:ABC-type branched-subunit amino acid transport system ATPase component
VPWYAIPTGIGVALVPAYLTSASTGYYLELLFGLSAIGVAVGLQTSMPAAVRDLLTRLGGRSRGKATPVVPASARPSEDQTPSSELGDLKLEVEDLTVCFGGLRAVDGLSFANQTGLITGLIGPNGAGKTTTFNACSGLVPLTAGRVLLGGQDVSKKPLAARAQRGLGRTFQNIDLLDSYTAMDNARLAAEAALGATQVPRLLVGRGGDEEEIKRRSTDALAICGLSEVAAIPASRLSNQQRRLLSLARCLAAGFRIVMLDEPSAGLDSRETADFGELLTLLARDRKLGIILVEHDMSLVMRVCHEIYVLDFGKEIMHGPPVEVQAHPAVQAAYLGEEPIALAPTTGSES